MLTDAAWDAHHVRDAIARAGVVAVIPNNPSGTKKHPFDSRLYKERRKTAFCRSKLKELRRIAMRHEKTARIFLAIVTITAATLWLKWLSTRLTALSEHTESA